MLGNICKTTQHHNLYFMITLHVIILLLFLVIFHKPAVTNKSAYYECRRHSQFDMFSRQQRPKIHRDRCLKFPVALPLNQNCRVLWTCTSFTVIIACNLSTPAHSIRTHSHVLNTHLQRLPTPYYHFHCSLQHYSGLWVIEMYVHKFGWIAVRIERFEEIKPQHNTNI